MPTRFAHIPGRHVVFSDNSVQWTWPGGYAESIFQGNELQLSMEGLDCQVRISIDDVVWKEFQMDTERMSLNWHGTNALHSLRIQTTHQESDRPFRLFIPQASDLIQPQGSRRKHIEFVGDSWTCGFGNLSESELKSDCTQAYAALVAKALDADYSLIAISGHGIVKNFGEIPPSPQSLPVKYPRTQSHLSSSDPCEESVANLGVILAGENDYSFQPYPEKEAFKSAFRDLTQQMRNRHPGIRIFLAGVQRSHPCKQLEQEFFEEERALGKTDLFWIDLPDLDPEKPLGYLWHPGLEHHSQLAERITRAISATIQQ